MEKNIFIQIIFGVLGGLFGAILMQIAMNHGYFVGGN